MLDISFKYGLEGGELMRTRILLPIIALLFVSSMSTVQAAKPGKLVEHEVYDGPFDSGWCKAVMHGTMIVHRVEEDGNGFLYDVTIHMLQKLILYTEENGDIVAILKMTMNYRGTVITLDGNGPFEALWTGKLVLDIVLNELIEDVLPPDKPETMHVVMWVEEGTPSRTLPPWVAP